MSDLKTMLPGFARLAARMLGVAPVNVTQRDAPQREVDPRIKAKFQYCVTGCMPIGRDEIRYVGVSPNVVETIFGLRKITIQVRCEGYDHQSGQDALFWLERLGLRIRLPSAIAELATLDLALSSVQTFHDISRVLTAEDLVDSVGYKDFIFTGILSDTPATGPDNPVNTIETVIWASSTINDYPGHPHVPQIGSTIHRP